jgi:hypothetical protein
VSTQAEAFQYKIKQLEHENASLHGDVTKLRDKWLRAVADGEKKSRKLAEVNTKLVKIKAALR